MGLLDWFKKKEQKPDMWKVNTNLSEKDKRWNKFIETICFQPLDTLSSIQKNAVLCFWYDAEMNSGGHSGYFDCYPDTIPQELIEAINVVGYKAISDNYIKALYEGEEDDWAETDMTYYKFEPSLDKCLMEYVEANKEAIFCENKMKEYIMFEIKRTITSWDKSDIYAISLFVYDEGDNPCHPTFTLGYNTNQHFKNEISNASSEQEAKWNYAFWPQHTELYFGMGESQKYVKEWLADNHFPYISSQDMFSKNADVDDVVLEKITEAFVNVLVEVVKELHDSGFIVEEFGKSIPILIHELECYDTIAQQNLRANPSEIVEEFVKFSLEG